MKLTEQQEKFVQELIKNGGNQRQAYLAAYPKSKNWKTESVDSKASNLLKIDKVWTRYQELLSEVRKDEKKEIVYTRRQAREDLTWLKERAKLQIEETELRQATAQAFLSSVKELIELDLAGIEELEDFEDDGLFEALNGNQEDLWNAEDEEDEAGGV